MRQEFRIIIAFVLSLVILYVYYGFIAPPLMPPKDGTQVTQTGPGAPPTTPLAFGPTASTLKTPGPTTSTAAPTTKPAVIHAVKDLVVETDKTQLILSTQGALVKSYVLKDYHVTADKSSPLIDLFRREDQADGLFLEIKGYDALDATDVFELVSDDKLENGTRRIVMVWQDEQLRIEKTFTIGALATPYALGVDYAVTNRSTGTLRIAPQLIYQLRQKDEPEGGFFDFLKASARDLFFVEYLEKGALATEQFQKAASCLGPALRPAERFPLIAPTTTSLGWGAISGRYFLYALIPLMPEAAGSKARFQQLGKAVVAGVGPDEAAVATGQTVTGRFQAYLGPKERDDLKRAGAQLDKAIDYGWTAWITIPILWFMEFLHGFIPNWGLVIIVLTFCVKILLHPVNKKSFASMKAMQLLQPKLKEIKDKYPEDKQKQQAETMQLFRTHKINPLSGCLLMFIQLPVYIALYNVLWNALELYHAPFFWLYNDLSGPDPYFILPALLGVFMLLQQILTPNPSPDPAQRRMMMFMPVMFTALMIFLPVGLVLYILVNTSVSVVQQFMIQRDLSFKDLFSGKWRAKAVA